MAIAYKSKDKSRNLISVFACFKSANTASIAIREALRKIRGDFQDLVLNYFSYNPSSKIYETLIAANQYGITEALLNLSKDNRDHYDRLFDSDAEFDLPDPDRLYVPIRINGEFFGILQIIRENRDGSGYLSRMKRKYQINEAVNNNGPVRFDQDMIDYFVFMGSALAAGISNIRSAHEAGPGAGNIDFFWSIITEITSTFDLKKIFTIVMQNAVRLLSLDYARLYLLDGQSQSVRGVLSYGLLEGISDIEDETYPSAYASAGVNIFQADLDAFFPKDSRYRELIRIIPLLIKNSVAGFLIVDNFVSCQTIMEADLHILDIMLKQAGIAIENAHLYHEIEDLAIHDTLTGLYNSRFFFDRLEEEIRKAVRYGEFFSVLMMDIDRFKAFNDMYGHQTGDMILKEVGRVIRFMTRESDIAVRYGGDEFIMLFANTDMDRTKHVAERIRTGIESMKIETGGLEIKVTLSIGGVFVRGQRMNAQQIIQQADKNLYRAKENGRNTSVIMEAAE